MVDRREYLIYYEKLYDAMQEPELFERRLINYLGLGFPIDFRPDIDLDRDYLIENSLPSLPILYAAIRPLSADVSIIKLLLENGANPDILVPPFGQNALLYAASSCVDLGDKSVRVNPEIINLLVTAVKDINITDKHNSSPLFCACNFYYHTKDKRLLNTILTLLEVGADINSIDKKNDAPPERKEYLKGLAAILLESKQELAKLGTEIDFEFEI